MRMAIRVLPALHYNAIAENPPVLVRTIAVISAGSPRRIERAFGDGIVLDWLLSGVSEDGIVGAGVVMGARWNGVDGPKADARRFWTADIANPGFFFEVAGVEVCWDQAWGGGGKMA